MALYWEIAYNQTYNRDSRNFKYLSKLQETCMNNDSKDSLPKKDRRVSEMKL